MSIEPWVLVTEVWLYSLLAFWLVLRIVRRTDFRRLRWGWLFPVTGNWLRRLLVGAFVALFLLWSLLIYLPLFAQQRY